MRLIAHRLRGRRRSRRSRCAASVWRATIRAISAFSVGDVDGDAGVLGLDVRADRDVVAVLGDDLVVDERGEVGDVLAAG